MSQISRRNFIVGSMISLGAIAAGPGSVNASKIQRHIVGTSTPAATRAATRRATAVSHVLNFGNIGQAVAGEFSAQARTHLMQRTDVRYVEADVTVNAISQTLPWGVDRVDAEVAHENSKTGDGADIAIIDTGIDSDHPDLKQNLDTGKAFVKARGHYAKSWDDDNGHGTHCAGIADAVDNSIGVVGVADRATLHAVKVLDRQGSGYSSDVAAGIQYAADQGWDVGSMSLGSSSGTQTLKDACTYAAKSGMLLVAAAGNSGGSVEYPATYDTVVAVSATNKNDQLPSWSCRGSAVDLAAPGVNIYSTYAGGGYKTLSGTSMACPHVSGAAALLMADGDTADKALTQLKSTAEDIGLPTSEQGAGLLDVANAFGLDSSDNLSGSSSTGGNNAPTGSITGVTETNDPSPQASFDVSWSAHDSDGNLNSLALKLQDTTASETEATTSINVSGSDASGTTTLKAHKDEGSGHNYTITLTVSDASGATTTDSAAITEDSR